MANVCESFEKLREKLKWKKVTREGRRKTALSLHIVSQCEVGSEPRKFFVSAVEERRRVIRTGQGQQPYE